MFRFISSQHLLHLAITIALILPNTRTLHAQQTTAIDLSGNWKFLADRGHKRGDHGDTSKGFHAPDFDDSKWQDLLVGTNWEAQGVNYDGIAWYRKQFTIPANWQGKTLMLQLGTPDDGAEVYLNGQSLGTWKFTQNIYAILTADQIQFGKTNTLAIRVWDWYKGGGLNGNNFNIQYLTPITQQPSQGPATLPLSITQNLPDDVFASKRWENGWRDGGTSDTRPKVRGVQNAYKNQGGIELNVWYPNSAEFVDAILNADEDGHVWQARDYNYICFWYHTTQLNGHMTLRLNTGKHAWGRRGTDVWQADFAVQPASQANNGWQQVVLPLSSFTRYKRQSTFDDILRLQNTAKIERLVIGYENHMLQSPGKITFANFTVGRSVDNAPFYQPINLRGLWRYQLDDKRTDGSIIKFNAKDARSTDPDKLDADHQGHGVELGYHKPDFDDSQWDLQIVSDKWMANDNGKLGPAWFRQQVIVPTHWQGNDLLLNLGTPNDTAKVYFNGKFIGKSTENQAPLTITIPAGDVQFGKANQLAIQVTTWRRRGGLYDGLLQLSVNNAANLQLAQHDKPNTASDPAKFEMGTTPPKNLDMILTWAGQTNTRDKLTVAYNLHDCFHRQLASGQTTLTPTSVNRWQSIITLDQSQTNQLYYSEWFTGHVTVFNDQGEILAVANYPNDTDKHFKLKYEQRDQLTLPPLAQTLEDTPYGKLKLVDVINCSQDPNEDPHPYKQGGIRNSWVKFRAYGTWKDGVTIESFKDRQYRQVNNNEFFAYRVGRGKLKPHKAYVLRVLVPDNAVRYQVMEIKTGRNYQGTGFRSGIAANNPTDPFPLTNEYQWYDHIVLNDEKTYGYQGEHTVDSENGFWVVFHDNGRCYSALYDQGPAAAEIRLYELLDDDSALPAIRYPEGLTHRTLMMDWERQPEAPPADAVAYAKLMGMNAIGPVFQKWSSHGFWESETDFAPPGWYKAAPEGERDEDIYVKWLDATRKANLPFIPRIEYGGGPNLPKEARVIAANGKVDPCGRYCQWGANILHDATWAELKTVVDELIGKHIKDNPQIAGLLWRQRQDRIKCSYGSDDVYKFCNETGRPMPTGNDKQIAQWASVTMKDQYHAWWQTKRADFLRKLRDHLKSYRSDLVLYYYNYDQDGWKPGLEKNSTNSAEDWSNLYNVDKARDYWQAYEEKRREIPDDFYVKLVTESRQPHMNIPTELYANDKDIVLFAPVHWQFLANNAPYINHFKTGDGLAICDMFSYEEKGRWNLQNDRYESSEMSPGGKDFGMAYMVESFYHGDPNVITTTTYTYGRGWADVHRRFAQAFLALPDQRGNIIDNALTHDAQQLRVRSYESKNGTYISIVSRAFQPIQTRITIPAGNAQTLTDLVTGQIIKTSKQGNNLVFELDMPAMTLNSYLLK
jgi:hypothetical protein